MRNSVLLSEVPPSSSATGLASAMVFIAVASSGAQEIRLDFDNNATDFTCRTVILGSFVSIMNSTRAQTTAAAGTARDTPVRIVLVGDSTVSEYPVAGPERGWGQFIEERFKDDTVEVINLATPGRSTKTFIQEGRWNEGLAQKPDYVLIQFGHNDSHDPRDRESTNFATDYKDHLRRYIDESRGIGARPILVTPVVRRTFDDEGRIVEKQPPPSRPLASYAEGMKEVAREKSVPVIGLYSSSKRLVETLGPDEAAQFANKEGDVAHFNEKGARAMAGLVMEGLAVAAPSLQQFLKSR